MKSNKHHSENTQGDYTVYEIRLKGHLSSDWGDWFGGLHVVPQDDGETVLTASGIDQAALYGLLRQIRDLGLPLISVIRIYPDEADTES